MEGMESSRSKTEKDDKKIMTTSTISPTKTKRSRRCLCLLVTAAIILSLGILFLILGLTVFKAKQPITKVDSVALSDLDFSLDLARLRVILNVRLDVGISVNNPNRVGFRYTNSTAVLRYRGNNVGEVPVPAGSIGARDTRAMYLTLTVMADRLLSDTNLISDAVSGTIRVQTYLRMAGEVKILIGIHVVTYTTCDLEIDLTNRAISDQKCHYRTTT